MTNRRRRRNCSWTLIQGLRRQRNSKVDSGNIYVVYLGQTLPNGLRLMTSFATN